MQTITINSPLDMHLHLRDGDMLSLVAPYSARQFAGALVMPNLAPPVTTIEALKAYRQRIEAATDGLGFEPFMTVFMQKQPFSFWEEARPFIKAAKMYPAGVTTNSEGGVSGIDELDEQLKALESLGIPLSIHAETHGAVLEREREFLPVLTKLCRQYPRLKVIFEHISSAEGAKLLDEHLHLFGTISLHHLTTTLDDLLGERLNVHLFCKPVVKTAADRDALLNLALNAHPKVMFGSDSAPHPKSAKESGAGAAGVFTAPVILPALAQLFDSHGKLENLQPFVSDNARMIYNIEPNKKSVTLSKEPFTMPQTVESGETVVVPFWAGKTLSWSVKGVE